MYNTKKELKDKIDKLMNEVKSLPEAKTDNVGVLEVINQYIKDTNNAEQGFETVKRCVVAIFYCQAMLPVQYRYPIHNKTPEKYSFTAYQRVAEAINPKENSLNSVDFNKIYANVIEEFLNELENKITETKEAK